MATNSNSNDPPPPPPPSDADIIQSLIGTETRDRNPEVVQMVERLVGKSEFTHSDEDRDG
jgi:hypothetical protein